MSTIKNILKYHTMKIVLVLVFAFFAWRTTGNMLKPANFTALINQNAYVYILATGMMMCMLIKGNIDLSVGSVVCFIDAIGAQFMVNKGMPVPVAMLLMLIVGLLIGALMGFVIAYLNIPPWIATLGGYLAFRGLGTVVLNGLTIGGIPEGFTKIFNGDIPAVFNIGSLNGMCMLIGIAASVLFVFLQVKSRATKVKKGYEVESSGALIARCVIVCIVVIFVSFKLAQDKGIPLTLVWVAVVALIYNFIASKTTVGRYFYTMGGNVEATRLSGIDTKKIMFMAYLNMAILTTVTAWVVMAKFQSANSTAGTNFEMDAISACVVGGVSAYGGSGSVFGMIIGATLIGVINLGMSLMGVDANWQKVVKGVVLLGAVVFDILNTKDKSER